MISLVPLLALAGAAAAAIPIHRLLCRRGAEVPGIFVYLTFVLPFAAGGFHTYTAMITTVLLAVNLFLTVRRKKEMRFVYNLNSAAVLFAVLCYCITPLWAADKGMAVFAIVRYLPAALYVLTLMQYTPEQRKQCMVLLPVSGAVMTLLSCALLGFAGMEAHLTVNGRLSAFLQYPNTYAAFLLAGLVINLTKEFRGKWELLLDGVLILGIVLSGSRTGFVLLIAALLGVLLLRRQKKLVLSMGVTLVAGLLLALLASRTGLLPNADRFTAIGSNAGSFLVRLLYFKDALPVILKNPFGLGYFGYRALEGTFQTGRYTVSFIHNGLLQLLLDIGWAPSLLLAAAFLRGIFGKQAKPSDRLLLLIVLGHCMMDFDLQFFLFWVILLQALDWETGTQVVLRRQKKLGIGLCALILAVCTWLGMGDLCANAGKTSAALAITPFHTDALSTALQTTAEPEELDALADRMLRLNPTHSLAWSAKANAAFTRGQVLDMMRCKEQAIRCARYTKEEYLDYFEKLYTIRQLYLQAGDSGSAAYCAEKLRSIPAMMEAVSRETDALAYLTGDDSTLTLPQEYISLLESII